MENFFLKFISCGLFMLFSMQSFTQSLVITGKVTDEITGEEIPGVIVADKNSNAVSVSESDGSYSILTGGNTNDTLTYSFLGYETQKIAVGKLTVINIQLKVDNKLLEELVIVAYGENTRKELTGSVSQVDAKKLEDVPIASVDAMLQGQVSGLQISSYSGQPGGEINIRLRGVGSITAGSSPLFVVDGIPINSGVVGNGFNITWTSNGLAGINPNDIESITVLKDASATAIYGSRGANGVIIITTKKGKAGKTKFLFGTDFGVNKISFSSNVRPLTADEFVSMTLIGMDNAEFSETHQENILENIHAYNGVNTDWLDEVTRTGFQNSYNLSAQGGDDRTQFYLSASYFNQEGVTIDSHFDRLSGNFSLEHKVSDKLHVQTNVMLSKSDQNTPYQSGYFRAPILSAYLILPTAQPYDSTGELNMSHDDFTTTYNPFAIEALDTNYYNNKKIIASLGADYEILRGLTISTKASLDQNYTDEFLYANPFYGDGETTDGWANGSYTDLSNWVWTNILDYKTMFLNNSMNFDVKLGHESQSSTQKILDAYGEGFPPNIGIQVLSAAAVPITVSSSIYDYTFESYFSNLAVSYRQKYSLSASLRRDASSRFGINNRYGIFYSVGAAWNIDEEDFFRNVRFLTTLKLRTSYGQNGNSEIGNYTWRAYYTYAGSYNGSSTSNPATIGNDNLTWEKNNPFNIGIDAGLFHDMLNISADWYKRTTSDLLLDVPISSTSGFTTQLQNIGAMTNKGIELNLDATIIHAHDFDWYLDANFSTNKNEISALYKDQEFESGYFIYRVGESYGTFYMPLWAGVNEQTGDPLWYIDSTMSETTSDITLVKYATSGNSLPKFFGGFTNTFSFKGLSLSTQFNYVSGNQIYDQWGFLFGSDGAFPLYNQYNLTLDAWQQPGDVTDVPKYVYSNTSASNSTSSRYLYDGDYIRLRDATLAYEINPNLLSKLRINSLKIYAKGTNLWTWTKEKDLPFDPDVSYGYGDANLPNIKTIIGGINIGF